MECNNEIGISRNELIKKVSDSFLIIRKESKLRQEDMANSNKNCSSFCKGSGALQRLEVKYSIFAAKSMISHSKSGDRIS